MRDHRRAPGGNFARCAISGSPLAHDKGRVLDSGRMCEHSSRIKGFVLVVDRRQADAVGSQQINGLHPAVSGFRHWFGFPIPSACNGGSSFLTGIRAVHDTKIPTVASYRRFPELRFRSLTGGTAVIDAYFSKKKPVIWNLATSLFSSFRTSTSITQERLPLLTSRATARRVFPEPGRMNETAALMAIHLSP